MTMRASVLRCAVPAVALAVGIGFACGPIRYPPPSIVPLNDSTTFFCSNYRTTQGTPSAGRCIINGPINPILVIDFPETEARLAVSPPLGMTAGDLVDAGHVPTLPDCTNCVVPAGPTRTIGFFSVNPTFQTNVSWPLPPIGNIIAIPAHVQFRPLYRLPGATTDIDATLLGLPLPPIDATVVLANASGLGGPAGTIAHQWAAPLTPGSYERTIQPDPPFDAVFPPEIRRGEFPSKGSGVGIPVEDYVPRVKVDGGNQPETIARNRDLRIVNDGIGPQSSLEGWTVYLRDVVTGRRVSQVQTLHDATIGTPFQLNTIFLAPPYDPLERGTSQTVVAPPAGSEGIPTLVNNNLLGENLAPDPPGDNPLHYPALPTPVKVSGTIQATSPTVVDADLFIRETSLLTTKSGDPARDSIHYSTYAKTDRGVYLVTLPPGSFEVYVVPTEASGLSAALLRFDVGMETTDIIQGGKNLTVPSRTPLSGTCVVDDERPLGGAEVEAVPAAELAGTLDRELWPRRWQTKTDADGHFTLNVDQGTYDIVVRPADGSGLPWTVDRSHKLGAEPVTLDTIRILTPHLLELTLHDNDSSDSPPVAHALVRAYAFPPAAANGGAGGVGGTAPAAVTGAAIQIGQALTDDSGHFQMFLTPLQ